MDSVLNVGMNDDVWKHFILVTGNPKFAHDLYRRFLQMYGCVVLKVPKESYLSIIDDEKAHDGVSLESHLSETSLENLVHKFKAITDVPSDPYEQLRRTIEAIFSSFYSPRLNMNVLFRAFTNFKSRAMRYRDLQNIDEDISSAVIVQSMVFGNLNFQSCTGKMITRNPDTGLAMMFGETNIHLLCRVDEWSF